MIHGIEWIVEYFENMDGSEKGSDHGNEGHNRTYPEGTSRISNIFLVLNAIFGRHRNDKHDQKW